MAFFIMAGFYNCLRDETGCSVMASGTADRETAGAAEECPGKKRSKFQTFKKLFAKKKRRDRSLPPGNSALKSSQSTDNVHTPEPTPVQTDTDRDLDTESTVNMGNKAMSHDSVFVSDSPSSETNDGLITSPESVHGKVKSLQLKQAIRGGSPPALVFPFLWADKGALSEDDGLPHSPPEISTLHTVLAGSSHKSSNPVQRTSSLSLEGSDSDDDQMFCRTSPRAASPLVSLPADFSQPASPAGCLDSSAAHHRIAVKRQACARRKPASREMPESRKLKVWGETPRPHEEQPSEGNTEPSAKDQEHNGVRGEQTDAGRDRVGGQGDGTDAQRGAVSVQQLSEAGGEEQSAVWDLSDKRAQRLDAASLASKGKTDPEEVLPASEPAQVEGPLASVEGSAGPCPNTASFVKGEGGRKEPGSLLKEVLSSLGHPRSPTPAEDEGPGPGPGATFDEGPVAPDIPHTGGPSPSTSEELGAREDFEEEGHEDDEGGHAKEQSFLPKELEEEAERMKAEAVAEICERGSSVERRRKGEDESAPDSADRAGLQSDKDFNSACGRTALLEHTAERSGSFQTVEDGDCHLEPPSKSSLTSDCDWPSPEEPSTTTANRPVSTDSENSTTLSQAPEGFGKRKARFTVAPAWQRSLSGGAPAPEAFGESPQRAAEPSRPDAPLALPRDPSSRKAGGMDSPFGVRLRMTPVLVRYSGASPSELSGSAAPAGHREAQSSPLSRSSRTKPAPPKMPDPLDNTTAKVKRTAELGTPDRKVASTDWISVARQKRSVFKENSLEETPGGESPFQKVEPQRKISLPISLNQAKTEQSKPRSSPLQGPGLRDISRPAAVEEGRGRALSHSPPSQDEPPWLALAKKKAKAWSETPQIVQ